MPTRLQLTCLLIVSCAAALPLPSRARAEPPRPKPEASATTEAATRYDFEDELVAGDLVSPFGELLSVRRRGARASLVTVRTSYVPELLRSIEDLSP
jgi:hypothetical protein